MKYLFILLLVVAPLFSFATELCKPNVDSCEFYLCQEENHHCGPKGYPVGFGHKFCKIYLDTEKNYSEEANGWLRRVRVCLMEEFANADQQNRSRTCDQVKAESFRSHVGCYVETGFCDLKASDVFQIFWAMKSSAKHIEIFQDAKGIAKACAAAGKPIPALW